MGTFWIRLFRGTKYFREIWDLQIYAFTDNRTHMLHILEIAGANLEISILKAGISRSVETENLLSTWLVM